MHVPGASFRGRSTSLPKTRQSGAPLTLAVQSRMRPCASARLRVDVRVCAGGISLPLLPRCRAGCTSDGRPS